MEPQKTVQLPIDGVLDLHTFQPKDVKGVVCEYLAECQRAGIFQVRIIHGKGIGNLRRTVRSILSKHAEVSRFAECSGLFGGAGATMVELRRTENDRVRTSSA